MKFIKALLKIILLILLGAVLMLLVLIFTGSPSGSSPGNSNNTSGTVSETAEVHIQQPAPTKEEEVIETPAVEIENASIAVAPQPEEIQITSYTFKVKNLDVYLNDRKIDYDKNNTESLESLIKNELLSVTDDTRVILDFTIGDYNTCLIVEKAVTSLGIEAEKIG